MLDEYYYRVDWCSVITIGKLLGKYIDKYKLSML